MREGDCIASRFLIGRQAGAGAMGFVFEARDLSNGATVAVKVLRTIGVESATRFSREAAVLARLSAPEIASYVAHGAADNGELYLVMEWIVGESLHDRLLRGPLSFGELVHVAARVSRALVAAHQYGVVHRDLKPANIMLAAGPAAADASGYPAVKVVDFGVARVTGDTITATGDMIGTLAYMSPEQARGAKDVDGRADLFALGAIMFRAIAGTAPFEAGDNMMATMMRLASERAPRIESLVPSTPPRLAKLIDALLESDARSRPADAGSVAHELEAVRSELAFDERVVPVGIGMQPTLLDRSRSIPPRRRGPLLALGALLLAAVIGTAAALIVPGLLQSAPTTKKAPRSSQPADELTSAVAPPPSAAPAHRPSLEGWFDYKDPGGAFEARVECQPRYKHTPRYSESFAVFERSLAACDSKRGFVAVSVSDTLAGTTMGCGMANRINEDTVLQASKCKAVSRSELEMGVFDCTRVVVSCERNMKGEVRFLCDPNLLASGRGRTLVVQLLHFVDEWNAEEDEQFWAAFKPHTLP